MNRPVLEENTNEEIISTSPARSTLPPLTVHLPPLVRTSPLPSIANRPALEEPQVPRNPRGFVPPPRKPLKVWKDPVFEVKDELTDSGTLCQLFGKTELTLTNWRKKDGLPHVRIPSLKAYAIRYDINRVLEWAHMNGKFANLELAPPRLLAKITPELLERFGFDKAKQDQVIQQLSEAGSDDPELAVSDEDGDSEGS